MAIGARGPERWAVSVLALLVVGVVWWSTVSRERSAGDPVETIPDPFEVTRAVAAVDDANGVMLALLKRAKLKRRPGMGGRAWLDSLTVTERRAYGLHLIESGLRVGSASRVVQRGFGVDLPILIPLLRSEMGEASAVAVADGLEQLLPYVDRTVLPFEDRPRFVGDAVERAAVLARLDVALAPHAQEFERAVREWLRRQ